MTTQVTRKAEGTHDRMVAVLDVLFHDEEIVLDPAVVASAVLSAAGATSPPLTAGERAFLGSYGGVATGDPAAGLVEAAISGSGPTSQVLTSAEVATRLGQSKPTVTRARERGDLYALASGGQLWFPAWQFTGDGALPGLRIALADLPPHWPAERLARFMATEDEFLDGLSPVEWLGQRSDPGRVAELLVAESHE